MPGVEQILAENEKHRERKRELLWFGFSVRVWPRKIGSVFILYGATTYVENIAETIATRCSLWINCIRSNLNLRKIQNISKTYVMKAFLVNFVNEAKKLHRKHSTRLLPLSSGLSLCFPLDYLTSSCPLFAASIKYAIGAKKWASCETCLWSYAIFRKTFSAISRCFPFHWTTFSLDWAATRL